MRVRPHALVCVACVVLQLLSWALGARPDGRPTTRSRGQPSVSAWRGGAVRGWTAPPRPRASRGWTLEPGPDAPDRTGSARRRLLQSNFGPVPSLQPAGAWRVSVSTISALSSTLQQPTNNSAIIIELQDVTASIVVTLANNETVLQSQPSASGQRSLGVLPCMTSLSIPSNGSLVLAGLRINVMTTAALLVPQDAAWVLLQDSTLVLPVCDSARGVSLVHELGVLFSASTVTDGDSYLVNDGGWVKTQYLTHASHQGGSTFYRLRNTTITCDPSLLEELQSFDESGFNPTVGTTTCYDDSERDAGKSYRGTVNTTVSGAACLRWDDDQPFVHWHHAAIWPYKDLSENYCRNPLGERTQPWCYVDNGDVSELCDVPVCSAQDLLLPQNNVPLHTPSTARSREDSSSLSPSQVAVITLSTLLAALLCALAAALGLWVWRRTAQRRQGDEGLNAAGPPFQDAVTKPFGSELDDKLPDVLGRTPPPHQGRHVSVISAREGSPTAMPYSVELGTARDFAIARRQLLLHGSLRRSDLPLPLYGGDGDASSSSIMRFVPSNEAASARLQHPLSLPRVRDSAQSRELRSSFSNRLEIEAVHEHSTIISDDRLGPTAALSRVTVRTESLRRGVLERRVHDAYLKRAGSGYITSMPMSPPHRTVLLTESLLDPLDPPHYRGDDLQSRISDQCLRSLTHVSTCSTQALEKNDLRLIGHLGKGSFGMVYLGCWGRHYVAVKVVEYNPADDNASSADPRVEASLTRELRHPNIVITYDFFWTSPAVNVLPIDLQNPALVIVMEFCDSGSLAFNVHRTRLFRNEHNRTQWDMVLAMLLDVAWGLVHLHESGVIHGDVKAANVMLKAENSQPGFTAKLADLGLAKLKVADGTATMASERHVGTLSHAAPEILLHGRTSCEGDVYAFGVLMYEVVTGKLPFDGLPAGRVVELSCTGRPITDFLRIPRKHGMPAELPDIFKDCVAQHPAHRPTIRAVWDRLRKIMDRIAPEPESRSLMSLTTLASQQTMARKALSCRGSESVRTAIGQSAELPEFINEEGSDALDESVALVADLFTPEPLADKDGPATPDSNGGASWMGDTNPQAFDSTRSSHEHSPHQAEWIEPLVDSVSQDDMALPGLPRVLACSADIGDFVTSESVLRGLRRPGNTLPRIHASGSSGASADSFDGSHQAASRHTSSFSLALGDSSNLSRLIAVETEYSPYGSQDTFTRLSLAPGAMSSGFDSIAAAAARSLHTAPVAATSLNSGGSSGVPRTRSERHAGNPRDALRSAPHPAGGELPQPQQQRAAAQPGDATAARPALAQRNGREAAASERWGGRMGRTGVSTRGCHSMDEQRIFRPRTHTPSAPRAAEPGVVDRPECTAEAKCSATAAGDGEEPSASGAAACAGYAGQAGLALPPGQAHLAAVPQPADRVAAAAPVTREPDAAVAAGPVDQAGEVRGGAPAADSLGPDVLKELDVQHALEAWHNWVKSGQ